MGKVDSPVPILSMGRWRLRKAGLAPGFPAPRRQRDHTSSSWLFSVNRMRRKRGCLRQFSALAPWTLEARGRGVVQCEPQGWGCTPTCYSFPATSSHLSTQQIFTKPLPVLSTVVCPAPRGRAPNPYGCRKRRQHHTCTYYVFSYTYIPTIK